MQHPRQSDPLDRSLHSRECCGHAAFFYHSSLALAQRLADRISESIAAGGSALIVATASHIEGVENELRSRGHDLDRLMGERVLRFVDGGPLLADLMHMNDLDGEPDKAAVRNAAGELIASMASVGTNLFIYGEMVNILWQRGNLKAADLLEQIWNDLIAAHGFTLLCGYRADAFDARAQPMIDSVCATHLHFEPSMNTDRFDAAVTAGLSHAFPHCTDPESLKVELADRCRHAGKVPRGLAALMTLDRTVPAVAETVRLAASIQYQRAR